MRDRAKVLLINNGYPSPFHPNYATYIASIAECLAEANCDVDKMMIYYNHKISTIYQIVVYIKFWFIAFTKNLCEYDYIYINHAPYAWPVFFNITFRKKRTIVHWHGNEVVVKSLFLNIARLVIKKRIKGCRHISPSQYFKTIVSSELGIPLQDILVSPSGGVDTSIFFPDLKTKDSESIILGFSSGMSKGKGSDIIMNLVTIVGELEKRIKRKVLFYIIDYGKDMYLYRERLCSNKNVVLIPKMPKNDMPAFYNDIDLLLMSSRRSESLGLVVLEAMSCGKPVVSFESFAFPEFVLSGQSGEMVMYSEDIEVNTENFCDAICRVISTYDNYAPRAVVSNNYSKEYVVKQYMELFV